MGQVSYSAAPKEVGQAWNRVSRNWPDQHGRIWNAVVSTKDKSGHPCSPLEPVDWSAPIVPAQKYFLLPNSSDPIPTLRIDYEKWLADQEMYATDWNKSVDNACLGFANGSQQLYARLKKNPTTAILEIAGVKPLDRRYILACQAGDRWALGFEPDMPAWARKIWDSPEKVNPANRNRVDDYTFLEEEIQAKAVKQETKRRRGRPRKTREEEEEVPHG
jgi:hypothetical protein